MYQTVVAVQRLCHPARCQQEPLVGKLVAPESASQLTDTGRFLVEMVVFGLSALAPAAAGQALLAFSCAVVAVRHPPGHKRTHVLT